VAAAYVLDATVVAAFQRIGCLSTLNALGLPLVVVDVVYVELSGDADRTPSEHQRAIRDAAASGFLRVDALPALDSPVADLMADKKLGLKLDLGEAASIALCLRSSDAVFVTSDRAGFFAAAKHLYPPRALSLYGFLRDLVASHALPFPIAQRLIDYADCGASLRPTWWAAWCRAHRVGPVTS
jgi:hypothetical protein